jgi:hypothetical protein
MTTPDVITILKNQQHPLAEKLKKLETQYRADRLAITTELQPLNKALKALQPKQPKATPTPKPEKKGGKAVAK